MKRFVRIARDRYSELQFSSLGKNIAIAIHAENDDPFVKGAQAEVDLCVQAVAALNDAVGEAAANQNLSPAGRAAATDPLRKQAVSMINKSWAQSQADAKDVAAERLALYSAPALEKGDVVGALQDIEIRQRYSDIPVPERGSFFDKAGASQATVLLAVMRDPINTPDKAQAQAMWSGWVDQNKPDEVKALALHEETLIWWQDSLKSLQSVVGVSYWPSVAPESQAA